MTLFLDYDGVLHPDSVYLAHGRPMLRGDGELFMWAPLLVDAIAPFPNLRIVLSTSWARDLSYSRARNWLPEGLRRRVVGATWHSGMASSPAGFRLPSTWYDQTTRYAQIKRYAARAGLVDWVAVDDQPTGWLPEDSSKLVHTDGDTGLSDRRMLALLTARLENLHKS